MTSTTAILFFTRSAWAETQHKTFATGKSNEAIAKRLIQRTRKIAHSSGLDVFETNDQQQGNTFGERLNYAIQKVFDKGYQQVIAIGNDSPQLTTQDILEAVQQLHNNNLVIGPSQDGGIYLLGIHKDYFQSSLFIALDWQTSNLLNSFKTYIQEINGQLAELATLQDVDTALDLQQLLSKLKGLAIRFYTILWQLVQVSYAPIATRSITITGKFYLANTSLRAPPRPY
ncbi:MAG: DUF2064 domain-containing protein [Aureispira sp.]|nr:DUF2064 domain-containing protein [Aureispira sp.]